MADQNSTQSLFDRWERVWHEGRYDLVAGCVADTYRRHDEAGDRTVSRDDYAAEIAKIHQARPGIRVVVYDHGLEPERAWFRFAFKWVDAATQEPQSRAGLQLYRIAAGRLAETWVVFQPLGSSWPDAVAQAHWTSPPPGRATG